MSDSDTRGARRRVTSGRVGLVCGALALTVSLGVPSEAAKLIHGKKLKNNTVTSQKIKNNNLTGKDVKNNSLRGADIDEQSLQGLLRTSDVAAYGSASDTPIAEFTSPGFASLTSTTFTVPRAGVLHLTGTVAAEDSTLAGEGVLLYRLRLDETPLNDDAYSHMLGYPVSDVGASAGITAVIPVGPGTHTAHLDGREVAGGSRVLGRELSVIFIPSGAGFVPPV